MSGGPRERRDTGVPAGPKRSMEAQHRGAEQNGIAPLLQLNRSGIVGDSDESPIGKANLDVEIPPILS